MDVKIESRITALMLMLAVVIAILSPCISILNAQVLPREQMLVIGGAYWEPPKSSIHSIMEVLYQV